MAHNRLRRMQSVLVSSAILIVLGALTSCNSSSEAILEDAEWCSEVEGALADIQVGWPVGNEGLSSSQVDAIDSIFREYSSRAEGDLGVAAKGLSQSFTAIAPYLAKNDKGGFEKDISDSLKQQSVYAIARLQLPIKSITAALYILSNGEALCSSR